MATFFDSIAESRIQNPIKSLWWSFLAKTVNNFELLTVFAKKKKKKKNKKIKFIKKKKKKKKKKP